MGEAILLGTVVAEGLCRTRHSPLSLDGEGGVGVKPGKDVRDQDFLLSAPEEGETAEKSRHETRKIDSVGR
jgi:hypothetical protein